MGLDSPSQMFIGQSEGSLRALDLDPDVRSNETNLCIYRLVVLIDTYFLDVVASVCTYVAEVTDPISSFATFIAKRRIDRYH
jgi:hypothetical protein